MEEKKQPKYYIFFRVLFAFFVLFLCLYSISINGYVQTSNQNKTLYTEEQIKKFEEDVKNGKEINIEAYLDNSKSDYSNSISNLGETISEFIEYGSNKTMELLEKFFRFLFQ